MSVYSQQASNVRKTWFLMIFFVSLISGLFYLMATVFNQPSLVFVGLTISIGQSFVGYFWGGNIAISMAGGQEISQETNPSIYNLVENLSRTAGIPIPKIFVSPDPSANAFACGRDPKHANICLNQGLVDLLDKNQLEGVIAHELAHIKNRDTLIMTMVSILSGVITFVVDFGFRSMMWGSGDDDNQSPLVFVFYIALSIIAPIISTLIAMSVSREREFLADATAVTMTRYPEGLITALEKLYISPIPTEHYSTSTNHFYIAPPKQSFGGNIQGWFSTHPKIEERVEALRKM
jgi:heat shock protein HtpX